MKKQTQVVRNETLAAACASAALCYSVTRLFLDDLDGTNFTWCFFLVVVSISRGVRSSMATVVALFQVISR